jgi:hypothetical protein
LEEKGIVPLAMDGTARRSGVSFTKLALQNHPTMDVYDGAISPIQS